MPVISGFESFDGATSRITGVTPSLEFGRVGKGFGINGIGYVTGQGWATKGGPDGLYPVPFMTLGFAFKAWSDGSWGGNVGLVRLYDRTGQYKGQLSINGQKGFTVYGLDESIPSLNLGGFSDSFTLKDDAWHYIQLVWASGAPGAITVIVDGKVAMNVECPTDWDPLDPELVTGDAILRAGPGDKILGVDYFQIGVLDGFVTNAPHMAFDDVYTGEGIPAGDLSVHELVLEGDVDVQLTPSTPGADNYTMVNEDPADDEDTYNESPDPEPIEDRFDMVDVLDVPAGGQLHGVQVSLRALKTRTAIWYIQPFVYDGSDFLYHNIRLPPYRDYANLTPSVFWERPSPFGPRFATDWTFEALETMQVGYRIWSPSWYGDDLALAEPVLAE